MAPTNNKTVHQTSFTPNREQPRSTRIVVAYYPRPAFSATNRTNTFQPVLINNSKFLKATHRTKIRKNEIPRSMGGMSACLSVCLLFRYLCFFCHTDPLLLLTRIRNGSICRIINREPVRFHSATTEGKEKQKNGEHSFYKNTHTHTERERARRVGKVRLRRFAVQTRHQ